MSVSLLPESNVLLSVLLSNYKRLKIDKTTIFFTNYYDNYITLKEDSAVVGENFTLIINSISGVNSESYRIP